MSKKWLVPNEDDQVFPAALGFLGFSTKVLHLGTPEVLGKWDKWPPYNPIQVSCFLFSSYSEELLRT